ncbi:MAG: hypothetical protein ABIP94_00520, partial [Planctomycetota bacterium]
MTTPSDETPLALSCRIPATADGISLVAFLGQRFRYHDRTAWIGEIASGRLLVNGTRALPEHRLSRGDEVTYLKSHREPAVD